MCIDIVHLAVLKRRLKMSTYFRHLDYRQVEKFLNPITDINDV